MKQRWPALAHAGVRTSSFVAQASLVLGCVYGIVYYASPWRFLNYIRDPRRSDLALYYREAAIGVRYGWGHVYDLDLYEQMGRQVGVITRDPPQLGSLGLPLLDWMVSPLTLLPLNTAYVIWLILMAAALAASFFLLAPSEGRRLHAVLYVLFAPLVLTFALGQAVALVVLGLAAGAWLLRSGREWSAGLALALTMVKPQLVVLVPICLLAAGRWRLVLGWAAVGVVVALGAIVVTGPGPLHDLLLRLLTASQHPATWQVPRDATPTAALTGLTRAGFQFLVMLGAALAAWGIPKDSRGRAERALAVGVVASLLVTPYLHFQDLLVLFPAAWLILGTQASPWERWLLAVGYLQAALAIALLPLIELGWLAMQLAPAIRRLKRGSALLVAPGRADREALTSPQEP